MSRRTPIAPILIPHGACHSACPYCPSESPEDYEALLPDPVSVAAAVDRVFDRSSKAKRDPQPVEVAFYGGDLWQLPRALRTALLDAAEWEVRRGRAAGIRITLSPRSVLRAPLTEFRARGIHSVELPIHSMDRHVLKRLGSPKNPRLGLEAIGRLNRFRFRSIVHLTPGLPGSSHHSALRSAELVAGAGPSAARLLPALVLEDSLLEEVHSGSAWEPMRLDEAVTTCRHILEILRKGEVEVIRVGLQPETDLLRGPSVLAGPWHLDFRGLVEGERMRAVAIDALTSAFAFGRRAFTFAVNPREESWLRGMEGVNVRMLREQFRLQRLKILPVEEQPLGALRVFAGELDEVPPLPPRSSTKRAS